MASCSHGRVDVLDVFTLGQGSLVATQALLGELVDALVDTSSSGLDHIQYTALIRCQTSDFAYNGSDHGDALAEFLQKERREQHETSVETIYEYSLRNHQADIYDTQSVSGRVMGGPSRFLMQ